MGQIAVKPDIPAHATEITARWLDTALSELPLLEGAAVTDITEIGTGYGLAGSAARVELRARGRQPSAAVIKLASKRSGSAELAFYRDLAPRMPCRVPRCYGGWVDADPAADRAAIVFEALPVSKQGDVLTGATADEAHAVLAAAAAFHAAFADETPPSLARLTHDTDVLRSRLPECSELMLQRYERTLPAPVRARLDCLPSRLDDAAAVLATAPATLVHTDFHLDNVLFLDGDEPAVLDWPGARHGAAAVDVGRFLVEGVADDLLPEQAALVAHYRSSRERAGAPVGPGFDGELDAALDLQLAYCVLWVGSPDPPRHPRMVKLVEAFVRRTGLLLSLRDAAG